jgi:Flp pilus assembly pilin Flp
MENWLMAHPALHYIASDLRARFDRVRSDDRERGASAVEWVVISMVLVGLCVAVGAVIYTAVSGEATNVSNCIGGGTGNNTQGGKC